MEDEHKGEVVTVGAFQVSYNGNQIITDLSFTVAKLEIVIILAELGLDEALLTRQFGGAFNRPVPTDVDGLGAN